MPFLKPTFAVRRAYELTPQVLQRLGVRALLLDVDNTLTTHGCPEPDANILRWLDEMKRAEVPMMILSNNREARVAPFAKRLGLLYESNGAKPLARGYSRCCERLGLPKASVAIVGDQIFTDIAGGNMFGIKTILVEPILMETGVLFRMKRGLERPFLSRYLREVRAGKRE